MNPGRVSQEVPNGDHTSRGACDGRAGLEVVADKDLRIGKLRKVARDRIVEPHRALLTEPKDADRHDGLGQGRDREDVIEAERPVLGDTSAPVGSFVDDPPFRPNVESRRWDVAPLDLSLDDSTGLIEAPLLCSKSTPVAHTLPTARLLTSEQFASGPSPTHLAEIGATTPRGR